MSWRIAIKSNQVLVKFNVKERKRKNCRRPLFIFSFFLIVVAAAVVVVVVTEVCCMHTCACAQHLLLTIN